ncbi:MAG: transcription termination factor NusA [Candidatus Raymondbacteria bacterium RifOxyA12_full_50_37]|uniref:Transcription termination/antitermination protein NusA n=1 Tax=Candidatus Raymondbacteria bacterium RIFOXYD12_FULL_49_13 TaxID=1817890 RepID=A0A1F7F022_UNCRA|nr:MAG: transcription termination factor NusA [Candidatus Raymondbacteria bacterium RifOxyB12_full_50_8]OGJ87219.1 MAG: transcription termination factor NusA [Candidatus Raymondbacteria bacterium RifOxyA12_full_50_37]OGJ88790.1 MAG: transcription termination factor NusA [Candidatus Raymondbacteria bacterium RIFOXYA2_FULL_49_16]OGJ96549.1 MAG: transcription termination factor NusA [Candidatus Raymondbacteria bacterium RIFOXYC2_FULL_50_21]OGJ99162.1 MAG: transcription termination factor NusA [Can
MTFEINELIQQISKEKNISQHIVEETIKSAFATAAKKYLGLDKFIDVKINRQTGEIDVALVVDVVEQINEEKAEHEVLLAEAQQIEPDVQIGDRLMREITLDEFGRNIILSIKQMVVQRIRDLERQKVFEDYKDRVGELITGSVQQVDRGIILVNLGRTEAIIPLKEQIRGEKYRQGDTIRAYILEVDEGSSGAQVILSRTHPSFLIKLFELEVPEIYDKIVEIKGVARDPGKRAKIAVYSKDERIDPVGSCVGMKGNRVQAIVRELNNERIDIIHWHENVDVYLRRCFHPSEIKKLFYVGDEKVVVIVRQDDLAQAIGKGGQNVRLASKLIKKQLDVFGGDDFEKMTDDEKDAVLTSGMGASDKEEEIEVVVEDDSTEA